jgi:lambda family phage portal protein
MPPPAILGPNGRPLADRRAPAPRVVLRGRYDAAETTNETAKHWAMADGLSARMANSPDVRRKLRERARYECSNNSICKGIIETLANDVIGTGPRLQLRTPDMAENVRIAAEFEAWTAAVGLAEKLRTMKKARTVDGEAFALLTTNPKLPTRVQLDLRLIEADQVATPTLDPLAAPAVDGIEYDRWGNPTRYHLLRAHPGDDGAWGDWGEVDPIEADLVLHWFRVDRPGQCRGIPDITPALPLFAQLRRFTLAVLAAAETAADFAAVLYSDMPPDGETADAEPFEELEITKRMMTTLPAGWKLTQFRAEQPAATYEMFKREILNEIARCLNMPFNVAAGNSSGYNYASGRLDHQTYYKSIGVDQYHLETAVLDRLFMAWLEEAYLAEVVDQPPGRAAGWPHAWFWDGNEHVDPQKEANAQQVRLQNNTTTLALEWARRGLDWRDAVRQRAEEVKLCRDLGILDIDLTPNTNLTQPAAEDPADG